MNSFSENFMSSVAKNIKKECLQRNLPIPTDRLILRMVKVFYCKPPVLINCENLSIVSEKLGEMIVQFLKIPNNPSITTLELQLYFNDNYLPRNYVLRKRLQSIELGILPVFELIRQKQNLNGRKEIDQMYQYIRNYVILISGIVDPSNNNGLEEISTLLKSVLTPEGLARFKSKTDSLKKRQLQDISEIIIGIKLFNDSEKETNETNQFESLQRAIKRCYDFFFNFVQKNNEDISQLIAHYVASHMNDESPKETEEEVIHIGHDFFLKTYLIFLQQINVYSRILLRENLSLIYEYESCITQLQRLVGRVQRTIKFKTAVSVVEIYPQFRDIFSCWNTMQNLLIVTNYIANIATYLRNCLEKSPRPKYNNEIQVPKQKHDHEKEYCEAHKLFQNIRESDCEYVHAKDVDFHTLVIQFDGFCPTAFVDYGGLLIRGIEEYGLLKHQDLYFSFSSTEAMSKFSGRAQMYINKFEQLAFEFPEIFYMLKLETSFDVVDGSVW